MSVVAKDILFACDFAARKHRNQRRKNAEKSPYIEHPIGVSLLLCGHVEDVDVMVAALLHDTIEDTDCSWEELESHFNKRVVDLVREVTDDKSLGKAERKRLQVMHARDASLGARAIKMADKLHNLLSIQESPPQGWGWRRIQGYFVWSKAVTDACCAGGGDAWIQPLKIRLDEVYGGKFIDDEGTSRNCCGDDDDDRKRIIDEYYKEMEGLLE